MFASTKFTPTPKKLKREKTTMSTDSNSDKDPVLVYCRLRPLENQEILSSIKLQSPEELSVFSESKGVRKEISYKFRHIFTSYSSQKEVFDLVAYPLLEDVLIGKNSLLFTYGVTGSGKTYTLNGDPNNPGIMPRCIDTIFNSVGDLQVPKYVIKSDRMNGFEIQSERDAVQDRRQDNRYKKTTSGQRLSYVNDNIKIPLPTDNCLYAIFVTYIEIYNNSVYDLLDEQSGKTLQNKILREDSQKNIYVNNVVEVEVKSAQEAFDLILAGQKKKKMAYTTLNAESSRSHSIFNIRIVQLEQVSYDDNGKAVIPEKNLIKVGQLSLVDLAGSERTNRTQNKGIRLKEAGSINNSLMSLRTCMDVLRENQRSRNKKVVPYRDSRLTYLFKSYFEGEGSIQMIVCVNPSMDDLEENLHVMKFAEVSQDVKITRSEPKYITTPKVAKKTITKSATPYKVKTVGTFPTLLELPMLKFNFNNIENIGTDLDKLMHVCKKNLATSTEYDKKCEDSMTRFRKRLVEVNQQNVLTKNEIMGLKELIKKERLTSRNYELKIANLETVNDNLAAKNDEIQEVVRSLHNTVKEKDLKLNRQILDKQKIKQKTALEKEHACKELEAKLRKQRDHLNVEINNKDMKLQQVKQIIEMEPSTSFKPNLINWRRNENVEPAPAPPTPKLKTPEDFSHRRDLPSSTPRRRRSRSASEVWLEHNAVKPVPLGTVLQPSMRKRKSVTKLKKASDITNPKQSKYCLLAQEQDNDGEIETKLYKADIVPTCGGGAQVIFNDVERLRQESPTSSPLK